MKQTSFDPELEAYLIVAMLKNDIAPQQKMLENDVSIIEEESDSQNYQSK